MSSVRCKAAVAAAVLWTASAGASAPIDHVDNFALLEGGQLWAGQGWAVFYPNPRGSTHYGEKFLRANVTDDEQ